MDAGDRELFERSLRAATERCSGADLDAALADLGWREALADDRRIAVSLLFELQGGATATSSALGLVMLDALGLDDDLDDAAVVLPAIGSAEPPGVLRDGRLSVAGLLTTPSYGPDTVLVVARDGEGEDAAVVAVRVDVERLDRRDVHGIDPWLALAEISGEGIEPAVPPQGVTGWPDAVAEARLALGHELVGASRTMLALARDHALERIQFGRPIATFQAVRHRLADTLVAVESAAALLDAAWLDGSPATAAMAKAMAGRAGRTAARHCQQVLAGIGFTTEHGFHRSFRRVLVLDELFDSARTLTASLGADLLATRRLPPLLSL
jgi:hypothetical protein